MTQVDGVRLVLVYDAGALTSSQVETVLASLVLHD